MADTLQLKPAGLYTFPNPLSSAPPGSLAIADNVVIDADATIQSRRGLDVLAETLASGSSRFNKLFTYQGQLLSQYDADKMAYRNVGVGWTDYTGSFAPPDADTAKTKSAESNSNFYFTSSTGVQKLDAYNATPVLAGLPPALDLEVTTTGSTGFLGINEAVSTTGDTSSVSNPNKIINVASTAGIAIGQYVAGTGIPAGTTVIGISGSTVTISANATATNTGTSLSFYVGSQVGYQIVWGRKDANKNLILGEPSQLATVSNTLSHSVNTSLTFTIPAGITVDDFYQVYRSPQTVSASVSPNTECQLVYEANPSSGEIAALSVTVVDITPDALRGATIYTADSQEGALQANTRPYAAKDLCFFKNCMLYANVTGPQRLQLTLLAVGGSGGIQDGHVLTVAGVSYTGHTAGGSENPPTRTFQITTSGTPAQNIADTANSIVRVINQSSSTTAIYARYMSAITDLPGKLWLESRTQGATAFSATASANGDAYQPALPTSGTSIISTADTFKNGIMVSKNNEPEAVPLTNIFFAGSAAYEIKRIIALRDSVFILKDDGIYKLIGVDASTFDVDLFDDTTILLAPESAVNLNNTIYALTNQGVVSISDTGVDVVSRPIEGDLRVLIGANLTSVKNLSFGVSYQSDRKYLLGIISNSGDTFPTQIYVYNLFTQTWTRWPLAKRCGIVNIADDKLYFGDALSFNVNVERKSYSYTDYVEDAFDVTVVSSSGTSVVLEDTTGIKAGDLLFQSSSIRSVITSVNAGSNSVVVQDSGISWAVGAATVLSAIQCVVAFQPQTGTIPEAFKQFTELELFFRKAKFSAATLSFFSDVDQVSESLTITGINNGSWGFFAWGSLPWGGDLQPAPIRTYVPRGKQRCGQLNVKFTHRVAYGDFQLNGLNIKYRPYSERITR